MHEVPHSRPVLIHGVSENEDLNIAMVFNALLMRVQLESWGVINQSAIEAGIHNMSLWATVPNYVAGAESPKRHWL